MTGVRRESVGSAVICILIACNLLIGFRWLVQSTPEGPKAPDPRVLGLQTDIPSQSPTSPISRRLFDLTNEQRGSAGVPGLRYSLELETLAQRRANDMSARKYYAHRDPDGRLFFDYFETGVFKGGYSCENLDIQIISSPEMFMRDWLNSARGHKECMLSDRVSDVGYAVAQITIGAQQSPSYVVVAIHAARKP
jgi:uncharacterized protein YkwD